MILATGGKRSAPKIPGLKDFEGRGVSYCAVCDAFFYRGKEVAVVGNGEFALHEAEELRNVTQDVTIYTDGKEPEFSREHPIAVNTMKIQAIEGDDKVSGLLMQSDTAAQDAEAPESSFYPADGVFVALGTAGSTEIARQMEQRSPIREISKPTKRWRQRFRDFLPQETAQADFSRFPRPFTKQYGSHQRRQICPAQKGIINKNQETLIVDRNIKEEALWQKQLQQRILSRKFLSQRNRYYWISGQHGVDRACVRDRSLRNWQRKDTA